MLRWTREQCCQLGCHSMITMLLQHCSTVMSLSAVPLKPIHQCPCFKSLIARSNFPWKKYKNRSFWTAKRNLYEHSGQERVNNFNKPKIELVLSILFSPVEAPRKPERTRSPSPRFSLMSISQLVQNHEKGFCGGVCFRVI